MPDVCVEMYAFDRANKRRRLDVRKTKVITNKMTGVRRICEKVEMTQRLYKLLTFLVSDHTCKTAFRFSKAHVCLRKADCMANESHSASIPLYKVRGLGI